MDEDFFSQFDNLGELLERSEMKLSPETLICECFCVDVGDIREVCAEIGAVDLLHLRVTIGLGLGCQDCVKRSDSWINKIF